MGHYYYCPKCGLEKGCKCHIPGSPFHRFFETVERIEQQIRESHVSTSMKLESNGDVLTPAEPSWDAWTDYYNKVNRPLTNNEILGLCVNKPPEYIGSLPMTEGLQILAACHPILERMNAMIKLYGSLFGGTSTKDDTTRQH